MNEYNGTTYDETSYEGSSSEGKSSEEIRAEIERKRSQMTEKIDTIQDRLSPDHLKQQAQTMVQDILQESTDAIIEFARTGSKQAGHTLLETIKANPMPSAVIGVGLGWLAINMMKSPSSNESDRFGYQGSNGSMYNRGQMDYGSGYTGSYAGGRGMGQSAMTDARAPYAGSKSYSGEYGYEEEWQGIGERIGKVGDAAKSAVGKVGETAQNIAGAVTGAAGSVAGVAQDAAGRVGGAAQGAAEMAGRAGEGAGSAAQSAMHAGQQARHQAMQAGRMGRTVQRSLEDNPIAFGAAALLAGVGIGLALPATRQERQLLGDVHDQFMDRAQEVATNVAESAKQVASEVQPRLQDTAQRVVDDLKVSGMQVSEDLKQTGHEAGHEIKQTLKDAGTSVKSKIEGSGERSEMHEEGTEIVSGIIVEEDESQP